MNWDKFGMGGDALGKTITEVTRETPVIGEFDVCVVGGSCTGAFAAIRAAQCGMRTAIVEKQNAFGGAATSGLVSVWHSLYNTTGEQQIVGGLTAELIGILDRRNDVIKDEGNVDQTYRLNTEELKIELDILVRKNRITPFLHTLYCGAAINNGRVEAVFVENKDGRGAIKAKFFIDASGDGDLLKSAGVPRYTLPHMQPPTMCAKILGTDGINISGLIREHHAEFDLAPDHGWNTDIPKVKGIRMHAETHVFNVNTAVAADLAFAEMEGRRHVRQYMDMIKKHVPEGDKIVLLSLPSYIGIRDTYHYKCLYQVTGEDILYGKNFPDAILNGTYRVDIHHSDGNGLTYKYLDGKSEIRAAAGQPMITGRWREETAENPTYYQIPYRAIIPDAPLGNLLLAGRMIGANEEGFSALRVMVNTNQMGEAAGVAAAIAVEKSLEARHVDPQELRKRMATLGSIVL